MPRYESKEAEALKLAMAAVASREGAFLATDRLCCAAATTTWCFARVDIDHLSATAGVPPEEAEAWAGYVRARYRTVVEKRLFLKRKGSVRVTVPATTTTTTMAHDCEARRFAVQLRLRPSSSSNDDEEEDPVRRLAAIVRQIVEANEEEDAAACSLGGKEEEENKGASFAPAGTRIVFVECVHHPGTGMTELLMELDRPVKGSVVYAHLRRQLLFLPPPKPPQNENEKPKKKKGTGGDGGPPPRLLLLTVDTFKTDAALMNVLLGMRAQKGREAFRHGVVGAIQMLSTASSTQPKKERRNKKQKQQQTNKEKKQQAEEEAAVDEAEEQEEEEEEAHADDDAVVVDCAPKKRRRRTRPDGDLQARPPKRRQTPCVQEKEEENAAVGEGERRRRRHHRRDRMAALRLIILREEQRARNDELARLHGELRALRENERAWDRATGAIETVMLENAHLKDELRLLTKRSATPPSRLQQEEEEEDLLVVLTPPSAPTPSPLFCDQLQRALQETLRVEHQRLAELLLQRTRERRRRDEEEEEDEGAPPPPRWCRPPQEEDGVVIKMLQRENARLQEENAHMQATHQTELARMEGALRCEYAAMEQELTNLREAHVVQLRDYHIKRREKEAANHACLTYLCDAERALTDALPTLERVLPLLLLRASRQARVV